MNEFPMCEACLAEYEDIEGVGIELNQMHALIVGLVIPYTNQIARL